MPGAFRSLNIMQDTKRIKRLETNMIRAAIFDIDNTLYDYDSANAAAMTAVEDYALKYFGWNRAETESLVRDSFLQMSREAGKKAVIHNRLIRFQRILELKKLPLSPHALRMYDIYWDTLTASSVVFPGLSEVLMQLREKGIVLGIGTNMTSVMQFRKLEALGLLPLFDFIVSSEEAGSEKPESALFLMCCDKAGFSPSECLYVGDNLKSDIGGAEAAGLKAAWFCPDKAPIPEGMPVPVDHPGIQEAAKSTVTFSSFKELPALIDRFQ